MERAEPRLSKGAVSEFIRILLWKENLQVLCADSILITMLKKKINI